MHGFYLCSTSPRRERVILKKILIGLFALSVVAAAQMPRDFDITLKAGLDVEPQYNSFFVSEQEGFEEVKYELIREDSSENGFEVSLEVTTPINFNFDFGFGIAYQRHGKLVSADKELNGYTSSNVDGFIEIKNEGSTIYEYYNYYVQIPYDLGMQQLLEEDTPYESIPLYLTARYNFMNYKNMKFYLKGNFGYSLNVNEPDRLNLYPNAEFEEYINDASELIGLDLAEYLADTTGTPLSDIITSTEYLAELEKIRSDVANDISRGFSKYVDVEVENGLYWGAGFGFEYNNWITELMYQVNYAEVEFTVNQPIDPDLGADIDVTKDFKDDLDYSRVTLSLGYTFNFSY